MLDFALGFLFVGAILAFVLIVAVPFGAALILVAARIVLSKEKFAAFEKRWQTWLKKK